MTTYSIPSRRSPLPPPRSARCAAHRPAPLSTRRSPHVAHRSPPISHLCPPPRSLKVHRAVYKGKPAAVKVQRAGLKELFDTDLKNLKVLAKLLDKFDPKSDGADRSCARPRALFARSVHARDALSAQCVDRPLCAPTFALWPYLSCWSCHIAHTILLLLHRRGHLR